MGKRLASIDLGTHTVRLLIAERPEDSGGIVPLARVRAYVRLGSFFQDTAAGGIIPSAGRAVVAGRLREFRQQIQDHGVEKAMAVATGVIREAQNREDFVRALKEETGIEVKIISGEEEARLTATAVHHVLNMEKNHSVVVDLGGGSTEFAVWGKDEWWVRSLSLGASVLTARFLRADPPRREELMDLRDFVRERLTNGLDQMPLEQVFSLVGTGGTMVTLGALLCGIPRRNLEPAHINGLSLRGDAIRFFFREMSALDQKKRVSRYGLDEERAEVFPAGVLLADEIMNFFSMKQLIVCFSDLLEGLMWNYVEENQYAQ